MIGEENIESRLRSEAARRMTKYVHPEITFEHQPINATECNQLQQKLRELVRQKVDTVRREYEAHQFGKQYDKVYQQFVTMTGVNEAQRQRMCNDIREMHQMADMLLHPPSFDGGLELSSSSPSSPQEDEDYQALFHKYQKMHKAGHQLDQFQAESIIRRAKDYYLRDRS